MIVLEGKIQANLNNKTKLAEFKSLSEELENIQAQKNPSMGYDTSNQALLLSLDALSLYNRGLLN